MPVMSLALEHDACRSRLTSQVSILKKVRLAGAVRPDDAAQLAVLDREIDVVVGDDAAVALGQAGACRIGPEAAGRARRGGSGADGTAQSACRCVVRAASGAIAPLRRGVCRRIAAR